MRAANGLEIPFEGWVPISFSLCEPKAKEEKSDEILVPVLVSRDIIQRPIIGLISLRKCSSTQRTRFSPVKALLCSETH